MEIFSKCIRKASFDLFLFFFSTSLEKVDAIKGLRLSLPTCNIYSTGRRLIDEETLSLSFVSLFSLFDVLGLATTHTRTDKVEDDRRSK